MADRRSAIPNTVLRQVREDEFQMSRMEFAAAVRKTGEGMGESVGCLARLVAAWEDGEVGCPRGVYRRILTRMTGRTMAGLGFRTGPALSVVPAAAAANEPREEGESVERRGFLLDGAGIVLGLPFGTDEKALGKIGVTQVRAVTKAVATLYEKDHDHGSAAVRQAASQALHTAYQWLQNGTYSTKTEGKLRSAVGALSIAAGWLSYDSGRPGDARSLYGEALAASRIADDRELEAHAFGCLSLLAKAQGRPREAVAAAQGAQTVARSLGSPRLLALCHMREAGGWALAGDASATDRAIVKAHHLYAKGPSDADPAWLDFFAPGELAGLESLARADLGQHERAAAGAEQAVLLHGGAFARNSALYTADIAIQHAVRDKPEPEAAAEAAGKVLAYLPEVRSDRLLQSLHDVAGALQRHNRVPVVASWIEEYRSTITATGGGRA
ncbi:hypothetical protein [Streptomyces acidiscabies]|uniref:55.5 kDa and 49.5 kDa sporulation proteins n=1 Tax=Streptomyces acidiscabies TaxID=42234 RepID=A0ABU4MDT0_9ACTN|nr:hypothetical protein [Streptomyces acidiscabies]MDX3025372.1 hypothetical protein [Streptomyces acidiscabies]